MGEYIKQKFFSNIGTRNEVRMSVINEFSKEEPGTGKGKNANRFTYRVEILNDKKSSVYLRRPANLHNGFDFLVCVENYDFNNTKAGRKRNYPKHDEIIDDLLNKREEDNEKYKELYKHIEGIYLCKEDTCEDVNIHFHIGYPVDMLLKTIKWMFIEQDIRYWNYSGRAMLEERIPKP